MTIVVNLGQGTDLVRKGVVISYGTRLFEKQWGASTGRYETRALLRTRRPASGALIRVSAIERRYPGALAVPCLQRPTLGGEAIELLLHVTGGSFQVLVAILVIDHPFEYVAGVGTIRFSRAQATVACTT